MYYILRIYCVDFIITVFNSYQTIHHVVTLPILQLLGTGVVPSSAMVNNTAVNIFEQMTPVLPVSYFLRTNYQE